MAICHFHLCQVELGRLSNWSRCRLCICLSAVYLSIGGLMEKQSISVKLDVIIGNDRLTLSGDPVLNTDSG